MKEYKSGFFFMVAVVSFVSDGEDQYKCVWDDGEREPDRGLGQEKKAGKEVISLEIDPWKYLGKGKPIAQAQ